MVGVRFVSETLATLAKDYPTRSPALCYHFSTDNLC